MTQPTYPGPNGEPHVRSLQDFRLNYKSDKYPLLAFIYAILAGGEASLHFDYSAAYNTEYLLAPYGGKLANSPEHVRKFIERLDLLETRTNGRTQYVAIDSGDWDVFLDCLSKEVRGTPHSPMFW